MMRLPRTMLRQFCTAAAPSPVRKVAFLGLGNMGLPMALNLAKAGFEMSLFDPSAAARDEAVAAGLPAPHTTAAAAAADADAVVTMLPNGAVCESLFLGSGSADGALLEALRPSTLVLDCSTIDAPTARRIHEGADRAGVAYLDTPVSGGTAVAKAGNLAFMCGGEASVFERARAVLAGMGPPEKTFYAGPAGSGQVAKACNNMLLAVHMVGTCEALMMGAKHGLEPEKLSAILKASSGKNWSLEVYNPYPGVMDGVPASNGYAPGFMVDLMVKDLGLAMDVAQQVNVDARMGMLAKELYADHQEKGMGGKDFSSIMMHLGSRSGEPLSA